MINLAPWTSPNNNYIDHFRRYNTLHVIKHFSHKVTNSDKKCMCQWKVATQRDCLEVLFCFEAHGFCTDYSLPVSSCPLRELFFKACSVIYQYICISFHIIIQKCDKVEFFFVFFFFAQQRPRGARHYWPWGTRKTLQGLRSWSTRCKDLSITTANNNNTLFHPIIYKKL